MLAFVRRSWWPVAAAAATLVVGVVWTQAYPSIAPETTWSQADLAYQRDQARRLGVPPGETVSLDEPSIRSHLTSLREGIERVVRHPQGFGIGNAGATALRGDVPLKAGESTYTELGVETGLLGGLVFIAWNLALLCVARPRGRRARGGGVRGRARDRGSDRRARHALACVRRLDPGGCKTLGMAESIDPGADVGHVHLKVADLDRSRRVLPRRARVRGAAGRADGRVPLRRRLPPPRCAEHVGVARRLVAARRLDGALPRCVPLPRPRRAREGGEARARPRRADHRRVGSRRLEAVYFRDPDDNGVELYYDRPKDEWPRPADGNGVAMFSEPLDVDALVADAG